MGKQILIDEDKLTAILNELKEIKSIVLSDKTKAQWLDEKQAAAMLGFKSCRYLRKKVKSASLPIDFTTTNGRSFQYSRKSIDKYLLEHSSITKKST